jgi:hypothetical protein
MIINSWKDSPLSEMVSFRTGVIFVLYSFIAFTVSVYFSKVKKIRTRKTDLYSNSKKH